MIPSTYPSTLSSSNQRQMVIYYLPSVSGLTKWEDYIPVKETGLYSPEGNSFSATGAILTTTLTSVTGLQAWVDYIPVYDDSISIDAWSISALGYLVIRGEITTQALAILASFGTDAHVYIPGVGTLNGLTAGNYVESTLITPSTVDGLVGGVDDATSSINATQATAGSRPTLRKGAVNLALYSGDLSNAVWVKNIVTATTDTITELSTANFHFVSNTVTVVNGSTYTLSADLKAGTQTFAGIHNNTGTASGCSIDLTTGTLGTPYGGSTASVVSLGDGWYRLSVTSTMASTSNVLAIYMSNSNSLASYLGAGKTIQVRNVQLELGTTASTYVKTTSTPASNQVGSSYWEFDGGDLLTLGSVPFQMADDICVIAGFKITDKTAQRGIFTCASNILNTPRIAEMFTSTSGYLTSYWADDSGGSNWLLQTDNVDITNQLTVGTIRSVGSTRQLRRNGAQIASTVKALGTASVNVATIGARQLATTGIYMLGSIYPVIVIKGTVSDADLLILEKFVGQLSGVTI